MAFYPFISKAKSLITTDTISYDELEKAKNHVIDVVKKQFPPQSTPQEEVRKHALARLLLIALDDAFSFQSYAKNTAYHYKQLLQQNPQGLEEVARDFFPSLEKTVGYQVSLPDFVASGKNLADQQLENGRITLTEQQLLQITGNAIEQRLLQQPQRPQTIPQLVLEVAEELRQELPKREFEPSKFKGKHLESGCIQAALKGAPEGKRYYGAMGVAIACLNDQLGKEKARQVVQEYVKNCRPGSQPFTEREAMQVLDWVYSHPTIRFSCRTMQNNGFLDEYCKKCSYPYRVRVTE